MATQKYYFCKHCGNIIAFVKSSGAPVTCCGDLMQEILPGSVDASVEKHVPVISVDGNTVTVTVGSVEHPMVAAHYIEWISIQTEKGHQRKELTPDSPHYVKFSITQDDKVISAYAYCNLHGLWKKES